MCFLVKSKYIFYLKKHVYLSNWIYILLHSFFFKTKIKIEAIEIHSSETSMEQFWEFGNFYLFLKFTKEEIQIKLLCIVIFMT